MRRFFSELLPKPNEIIALQEAVSHHLLRVVGIAPNEKVELFDGKGKACIASLSSVDQGLALMECELELQCTNDRPIVWVGLSLTKKDAFSTALRMLTEIGVSHIVPIQAAHSVVKGAKPDRWQKIVLSAVGQSKQSQCPKLHPLQTWKSALDLLDAVPQKRILHTSQNEEPLSKAIEETAVLLGPEGGFTEKEVSLAIEKGWTIASLSSNILKADTAAIVAGSRLF